MLVILVQSDSSSSNERASIFTESGFFHKPQECLTENKTLCVWHCTLVPTLIVCQKNLEAYLWGLSFRASCRPVRKLVYVLLNISDSGRCCLSMCAVHWPLHRQWNQYSWRLERSQGLLFLKAGNQTQTLSLFLSIKLSSSIFHQIGLPLTISVHCPAGQNKLDFEFAYSADSGNIKALNIVLIIHFQSIHLFENSFHCFHTCTHTHTHTQKKKKKKKKKKEII